MIEYDPALDIYLKEFQEQDIALRRAEIAKHKAELEFDLALRHYTVTRDVLLERFGLTNVYKDPGYYLREFGLPRTHDRALTFPTNGRYRFAHMAPSQAVTLALGERKRQTLKQLVRHLRDGGMTIDDERTINAVLRNTSRFGRDDKERYYLVAGAADADYDESDEEPAQELEKEDTA
jgi:hypothetical protein